MNLKINYNISILHRNQIDKRTVYNLFYHGNQKIIYVCDENRKLEGIITVKFFLENLKENNDSYIRNKYAFVPYMQNVNEMINKAALLIKNYHIKTAIPVLDTGGHLCFEIKVETTLTNSDTLKSDREIFSAYTSSVFLKEEVKSLKRVLQNQKMIVIGSIEQLEESFGELFDDISNISFIKDNIRNAYDFFAEQEKLVLDLCTQKHEGRKDIYWQCQNGYSEEDFWDLLLRVVRREECSRFFKITEKNKNLLEEIIELYHVCFLVTPLLKADMIKYLHKNQHTFIYQEDVFKSDTCKFVLTEKDENLLPKDLMLTNIDILTVVDSCIEYAKIYEYCKKKVKVLNFVCGMDIKLSPGETERVGNKEAVLKYIDEMRCGETENWMFDIKKKPCTYMADLYQFNFSNKRRFENDLILFEDCNCELVNIENGIRKTYGEPEEYVATIYFIGFCTIYGRLSEDKATIPSVIQELINKSEKKYRVVNLGTLIPMEALKLLEKLKIKKGDIFVIFYSIFPESMKKQIPVTDICEKVNMLRMKKYQDKEIYLDMMLHISDYGNMLYGEVLYEEIEEHLTENEKIYENNIYALFKKDYRDLEILYGFEEYLTDLRKLKEKVPSDKKRIGSVVMNCNPFTLGHQYLIEFAAKQMDYLYLFVVEEDMSYFSFSDRLEMVRKGTEKMENVCVLRSGKGCASGITMPQYFGNKYVENRQMEKIPLGLDLRLFSQYIAPELNIGYRFIGEEPLDQITRQYNQTMQHVLPKFGIEVIEISRKNTEDGSVISASKVREAFQNGNLRSVQNMIPFSTKNYLYGIQDKYLQYTNKEYDSGCFGDYLN